MQGHFAAGRGDRVGPTSEQDVHQGDIPVCGRQMERGCSPSASGGTAAGPPPVSSDVACAMRKGGAAELTWEIGLASRIMASRSATVPPNNCVTTASTPLAARNAHRRRAGRVRRHGARRGVGRPPGLARHRGCCHPGWGAACRVALVLDKGPAALRRRLGLKGGASSNGLSDRYSINLIAAS